MNNSKNSRQMTTSKFEHSAMLIETSSPGAEA